MLLPLLPLLLLPTSTLGFFSSSANTAEDESLKIPGDNPLYYCEDPIENDYKLLISNVDLDPNPPRKGETLHIKATGNFTKEVVDGAYVVLNVKVGSFSILKRTEDLCEQMKNIDKECPIGVGETTITKDVDIPAQIPPAKFFVTADVFNVDDERITCLTASAQFPLSAAAADKKKSVGDGQVVMDKESIDL